MTIEADDDPSVRVRFEGDVSGEPSRQRCRRGVSL